MRGPKVTNTPVKVTSFRLRADAIDRLNILSMATGLSKTEVLYWLITNAVRDPDLGGLPVRAAVTMPEVELEPSTV